MRAVPLARRNLLAEPRRLTASAAGVGMAIMLVLLLDGLWAGIKANVTTYEDHIGADLFVAQPGTRNFFGAISLIPIGTVTAIRADSDVNWAAPVRGFFSIVELHHRKVPSYVIGFVPGQRGGPWQLRQGRAPARDNEVAIGSVMARRHGLSVGSQIEIMGTRFDIVGTSTDAFMASFVFMTHTATDRLLSSPTTTSFVLVGTSNPVAVRARLAATGLSVLDRDELGSNDIDLMARAYGVPLSVMRIVAFTIGSLVIALTVYTAIMDRRREYGIFKALGARGRHLARVALEQSFIVAGVGLAAGAGLFVAAGKSIVLIRPQFAIVVTITNAGRAVGAATLMALTAAIVPALRLSRLEPAVAYRDR